MSYAEHVAANRRLTILRLLEQDADFALNDSVLQIALSDFGHGVSCDVVHTEMAWLSEQGLITVEVVQSRVRVAKLTTRGLDVAKGRAVIPGVQRPSPSLST